MKRLIGIALATGLLATACRPMGLPVDIEPAETSTAAARQTSPAIHPEGASDATEPLQPTEPSSPSAGTVPGVEIDLSGLDGLLTQLDNTLANLDSAMQEGDEK